MGAPEEKMSDKEMNFRALEARLREEKEARLQAEKVAKELLDKQSVQKEEDDGDDEPYVDKKRLEKRLKALEKSFEEKLSKKAEEAKGMVEQTKNDAFLRQNADFYDVLKHADKLLEKDPELAEAILQMPDGFERQKLVYRNVKFMGLDKPQSKEPSVQEKIDANRRSPYYIPSGVGQAPYGGGGDFSVTGQKNAYAKMQELKSRLGV
jgi:hypothetical protein